MIAAATLTLTGCVYLRLLQVKNQLAKFDRYFETDVRDGLKLMFKEPVLLAEDFSDFFKWIPESRQKSGAAEKWHFRWLKESVAADGAHAPYAVELDFIFVDGKLAKLIAPEIFFATFMPKELVISSLKALGGVKVDEKARSVNAKVQLPEGGDDAKRMNRPTRAGLVALLGEPVEVAGAGADLEWRYRFHAASAAQRLGKGGIDVTFTFHPAADTVRTMRGTSMGISVAMDYGKADGVPQGEGATPGAAESAVGR